MSLIGIDGCPAGWCAAIHKSQHFSIRIYTDLSQLLIDFPDATTVWIDMPMGLGSSKVERNLDAKLRSALRPKRHSSVFTPPVREALYQQGYQQAKKINRAITGKAFSIQAWNIAPKVREIDQLLIHKPSYRKMMYEAHPELCFFHLNDQQHLEFPKAAPGQKGVRERLTLLTSCFPEVQTAYYKALTLFPRKSVRRDDLVDALCLVVCALLAQKNIPAQLQNDPPQDEKGIPMRLVYFQKG